MTALFCWRSTSMTKISPKLGNSSDLRSSNSSASSWWEDFQPLQAWNLNFSNKCLRNAQLLDGCCWKLFCNASCPRQNLKRLKVRRSLKSQKRLMGLDQTTKDFKQLKWLPAWSKPAKRTKKQSSSWPKTLISLQVSQSIKSSILKCGSEVEMFWSFWA